jgi:flavodoxin
MFEVVYYSQSGNTRKVADIIADELWTIAKDITQVDTLPEDAFIFLGTECSGLGLAREISDFIGRNRLPGRKIALFTTSASGSSQELAVMERHLLDKGVDIVGRFNCDSQFLAVNTGHPFDEYLEKARVFARTMVLAEYPQLAGMELLAPAAFAASQVARLGVSS